jgi:hypothetical protein
MHGYAHQERARRACRGRAYPVQNHGQGGGGTGAHARAGEDDAGERGRNGVGGRQGEGLGIEFNSPVIDSHEGAKMGSLLILC